MRIILFCAFLHFVLSKTADRRLLKGTLDSACSTDDDCDTNLECNSVAKACKCPELWKWDSDKAKCIVDKILQGYKHYGYGKCTSTCDLRGYCAVNGYFRDDITLEECHALCEASVGCNGFTFREPTATVASQCRIGGTQDLVVPSGWTSYEQPGQYDIVYGRPYANIPYNCFHREETTVKADCVRDVVATAASCNATCATVPPIAKTKATGGGAGCSGGYECMHGNGECIICAQMKMSTNSKCGATNGNTVCPFGKFCSNYGWCGSNQMDYNDGNTQYEVPEQCQPRKITFTMTISMPEANVTESKDLLRKSIAALFKTELTKVFITVKSTTRRMLAESSNLEVEITNVDPDDVQGHKDLMAKDSFEADLAAEILKNTQAAVTISDVSDPTVATMPLPSSPDPETTETPPVTDDGGSGGEEGGIIGGILGALCCCCCCAGAYYAISKGGMLGGVFEMAGENMSKGMEQAKEHAIGEIYKEAVEQIEAHTKDPASVDGKESGV